MKECSGSLTHSPHSKIRLSMRGSATPPSFLPGQLSLCNISSPNTQGQLFQLPFFPTTNHFHFSLLSSSITFLCLVPPVLFSIINTLLLCCCPQCPHTSTETPAPKTLQGFSLSVAISNSNLLPTYPPKTSISLRLFLPPTKPLKYIFLLTFDIILFSCIHAATARFLPLSHSTFYCNRHKVTSLTNTTLPPPSQLESFCLF